MYVCVYIIYVYIFSTTTVLLYICRLLLHMRPQPLYTAVEDKYIAEQ